MYLSILWQDTQKSNTELYGLLYMSIISDKLLIQIYNDLQKEDLLKHVRNIHLTKFDCSYTHATSRVNVTQWLIAMSIDIKYCGSLSLSLCLNILCREKRVIWAYLIFLYFCNVFSKSLWYFLCYLRIYIFAKKRNPLPTSILSPLILTTLCKV